MSEPMSCAVCHRCEPHPENPTRCIYGGPYRGYLMPDATWRTKQDFAADIQEDDDG